MLKTKSMKLCLLSMLLLFAFGGSLFWAVSCTGESNGESDPDNYKVTPLLEGTAMETDLYVISSGEEGPIVMIVGGTHGNETAGFIAAEGISGWNIDSGTLLVIPRANQEAIAVGSRTAPGGDDLNRAYPGDKKGTDTEKIAAAIFAVMQEYEPEWVLDLHESSRFYLEDDTRLGQTLITYPDNESFVMSLLIIDDLNQHITEPLQQFSLLEGGAEGSTTDAAGKYLQAKAIITETTRTLPLEERVFQQLFIVNKLLSRLDMKEFAGAENLQNEAVELIAKYDSYVLPLP